MKRLLAILMLVGAVTAFSQTFNWDGPAGKPKLNVPAGTGIGIGDVANGNYFGLDRYGRYLAIGDSAIAYGEILITPYTARINPVNTKPDFGTWLWPGQTFLFDAAAPESIFFQVELPHDWKIGSPLDAHVHWAATTTNTGKAAWKLSWMIKDIGGTFAFAAGDTLSAQQAGTGTAFQNQLCDLGDITMTGVTGVSAIMSGLLIRDAAKGSDDYTGDAAFLDLGFHYMKDSIGSRWEFTK